MPPRSFDLHLWCMDHTGSWLRTDREVPIVQAGIAGALLWSNNNHKLLKHCILLPELYFIFLKNIFRRNCISECIMVNKFMCDFMCNFSFLCSHEFYLLAVLKKCWFMVSLPKLLVRWASFLTVEPNKNGRSICPYTSLS